MPINRAMRAALRALSYPANIDLAGTYKVERAFDHIRKPLLSPLYQLWDKKVERNGHEVRIRIYSPRSQTDERLLLFFHGGGWVHESVDTYSKVCRNLSHSTGCRVASVEYRLAPEYVFPEGLEDCYAAAQAVYKEPELFGVKASEITLIGDSAGGNLAAAVSLMARDRGEFEVSQQILIYPATYNDHTPDSRFGSVRTNGTGYLLTAARIENYMAMYAGDKPEHRDSPYFAPLLADDLTRQPRTLVITAEYDPLRDEGEAYAHALREAGNDAVAYRMPNTLHGYFSLPSRFTTVRKTFELINYFLNGEATACQNKGKL